LTADQLPEDGRGQDRQVKELAKDIKKLLGLMDMFIILMVMMVFWV
jgi:hypothetical protein